MIEAKKTQAHLGSLAGRSLLVAGLEKSCGHWGTLDSVGWW